MVVARIPFWLLRVLVTIMIIVIVSFLFHFCHFRLIERDEYEYDHVILSIYFGSLLTLSSSSAISPTSTALAGTDDLASPWLLPLGTLPSPPSSSSSSFPLSIASTASLSSPPSSALVGGGGGGGSFVNELFYRAHKLVDEVPQSPIAWYAVACYYYAIQNYEAARRYFR